MNDAMKYEAICCDVPMRNMGWWPSAVALGKWSKPDDKGVVEYIDMGHGTAVCNRYHCLKCNRYIAIAGTQEPRS